jgi:RNA polymerase sigma factor (sigma-70 family)
MSSADEGQPEPALRAGAQFATTQWSVVLNAGRSDLPEAREALEKLCRTYWYPLYLYVRRQGHSPEDAEDLTQGFFARLIGRRDLEVVRRERGRFRSYLLVCLKHFLVNEWKSGQRLKRGGGQTFLTIDHLAAEDRYADEPGHNETPEKAFERGWAATILEQVLRRLQAEYSQSGRAEQFELLRAFLLGEPDRASHGEIAHRLGTTEGTIKQALHRLRKRYREALREEIAQTVATPGDIEEELRHLVTLLRS